MPSIRNPRHGSMGVWPRKRAKREVARVRSWANIKDAKPLGFAGYKVGMIHLLINDNRPHSKTKDEDINCPATLIECPPLKVLSARFYKNTPNGLSVSSQIQSTNIDKELHLPKVKKGGKTTFDKINLDETADITLSGV